MAIGFNCALGAKQTLPFIQVLAKESPYRVSVHPNAGLPNELGEYDETPQQMADILEDFMKSGLVNIVGGCCGTTVEHIRIISEVAKKYKPRPRIKQKQTTSSITNEFCIKATNINWRSSTFSFNKSISGLSSPFS